VLIHTAILQSFSSLRKFPARVRNQVFPSSILHPLRLRPCRAVSIRGYKSILIMNHKGRIARLPREIREELNRRLTENENGGSLLRWLNDLPAANKMLAREFAGKAVTKHNLYQWRIGGFPEWQARQDMLEQTRELVADAREANAATGGKLADHLATVLAVRYAAALSGWNGEADEPFRRKLRVLRSLCQDIVELRRGDHSGAWLQMEQDRLGREQEKTDAEVIGHFERWLKNTGVRDWVCKNWTSPKARRRHLHEIFGLQPEPPETRSRRPKIRPAPHRAKLGDGAKQVKAGEGR